MLVHDLAGEAEADASAVGLGGVERDEDLLLFGQWDGLAVVGDIDDGLVVPVEGG